MADQAFKKDHVKTTIQNYPSKHQNGATLDIAAEYSFKPKNKNTDSYFTTREVNDYIDHYLKNYPNLTDYWEVQNLNLASNLAGRAVKAGVGFGPLQQFLPSIIDQIRTRIDVQKGASNVPFSRSSIVETDLDGNFKESFEFKVDNGTDKSNDESPVTVTVNYQYRPPANNYLNPYFEFSQVANYVKEYTENYSNTSQQWNQFAPRLSEALTSQAIDQSYGFVGINYYLPEYIDGLSITLDLGVNSPSQSNPESWSYSIDLPEGDALEAAIGSAPLQNRTALYDLRQFDNKQELTASLERDGVIANPIKLGFYRVEDTQGRVRDSITGSLHDPQDDQYLTVAMSSDNRIANSEIVLKSGTDASSADLLFQGGSLVAPFFINADEQTVVPFANANSSSDLSIQRQDLSTLLLNDPSFCNSSSCTPVEINLDWFIS